MQDTCDTNLDGLALDIDEERAPQSHHGSKRQTIASQSNLP